LIFIGNKTIIRLLLAVLPVIAGGILFPVYGQVVGEPETNRTLAAMEYSTKRATLLAVCIPGAGQAYNRKYWKIPIAYAGYAGAGFALVSNQRNYKQSKANYIALTDDDPGTVYEGTRTKEMLLSDIDGYRRYRDLSALGLIAWHLLCVVDANVDAHFLYWDIDEDLSLRLAPAVGVTGRDNPLVGLILTFNIK
jgi:hypothetical protein